MRLQQLTGRRPQFAGAKEKPRASGAFQVHQESG
jgi:hypothetical protein